MTTRRPAGFSLDDALASPSFTPRNSDLGALLEPGAQRLAEVGHGVETIDVAVMDPLHDLVRAEALLAQRLEERFHPRPVEAEEIDLRGSGRGRGHV